VKPEIQDIELIKAKAFSYSIREIPFVTGKLLI